MSRVVHLVTAIKSGPVPEIIEALEKVLEDAKSGKLSAVMIAGLHEGNELGWFIEENGQWAKLLAAIECAKFDMMMDAERG